MDDESLFAQALAIESESERQAFLEEACGGNAELRAEVEALLRANDDAGSFLNHPPVNLEGEPDATIGAESGEIPLTFLEPCEKPDRIGTLGTYEIIDVVGRGGMGIVLRALDTKLNRTVAVKVLTPELAAKPMAVRRFLSEAQKAAAVVHEHVVTIHAVDDAHRPPFLVMEFVEGQTLQQKIDREGALQLVPILRIGTQIAEGLAAAHVRGLIHRDVKPANILLENGVERVKIADFGLARAADDARVTVSGQVTGTPLYMSPEQAQGDKVDHRSDLFSLGSVLYTMCTGRPPFRADTAIATLRRVCDDSPRPIRELNSDIPPWLETIISKLLAKQPVERFQSAAEVAELLGQHLAQCQSSNPQSGIAALEDTRAVSGSSRKKKRRPLLIALAAAVMALVVAGVWFYRETRPPYPGAEQCSSNGHWYKVVDVPEGISWEEAHERAIDMGGHLLTVTDQQESDFVIRRLKDQKYWYVNPIGVHNLGPWLGAIQLDGSREPDGGWRWITGEPFLYSAWHIDNQPEHSQPNDGLSPYTPQTRLSYCMRGNDFLRARWGDVTEGDDAKSFVVEFDDLPVVKSHPVLDPYGSLFIREGTDSRRVGLNITCGGDTAVISDLTCRYRVFVPPGTYHWKLLDLTGTSSSRLLNADSIQIEAGACVEFTTEGPITGEAVK